MKYLINIILFVLLISYSIGHDVEDEKINEASTSTSTPTQTNDQIFLNKFYEELYNFVKTVQEKNYLLSNLIDQIILEANKLNVFLEDNLVDKSMEIKHQVYVLSKTIERYHFDADFLSNSLVYAYDLVQNRIDVIPKDLMNTFKSLRGELMFAKWHIIINSNIFQQNLEKLRTSLETQTEVGFDVINMHNSIKDINQLIRSTRFIEHTEKALNILRELMPNTVHRKEVTNDFIPSKFLKQNILVKKFINFELEAFKNDVADGKPVNKYYPKLTEEFKKMKPMIENLVQDIDVMKVTLDSISNQEPEGEEESISGEAIQPDLEVLHAVLNDYREKITTCFFTLDSCIKWIDVRIRLVKGNDFRLLARLRALFSERKSDKGTIRT